MDDEIKAHYLYILSIVIGLIGFCVIYAGDKHLSVLQQEEQEIIDKIYEQRRKRGLVGLPDIGNESHKKRRR